MGRPRGSASEQDTVERLLSAAEAEFGRVGFFAARLEDIARAAKIRRPSLLYHFSSKEDLYRAVVHRAFDSLGEMLAVVMEDQSGSFLERVDRVVEHYLNFLQEHPALPRILLREILDGQGPGQELLMTGIVPILDAVERFVREEGKGIVPPDLPVRQAVLQSAAAALLRAACPEELRAPLWGKADATRALTRALLQGTAHGTAPTPQKPDPER